MSLISSRLMDGLRCPSCQLRLPRRCVTPRPSSLYHYSTSTPQPSRPRYLRPLTASLLLLPPPIFYLFSPSPPVLSPQTYSNHPCSSIERISPQHVLLSIPIPPASIPLFDPPIEHRMEGEVTIQHVMIKSPDLQIERPYTPVNDVRKDGEVKVVVKRVKGGEVGRLVHSLKPGEDVGIRGPIPTISLLPSKYDKIIMISTGTGVAPFLQFLSRLPPPRSPSQLPHLHLIHALPEADQEDWVTTSNLLPQLQQKMGTNFVVDRIPPGPVQRAAIDAALDGTRDQRVMVLVCLPPALLRPLCGPMTPTLDQGEVTGLLRDLGLTNAHVWKLE